MSKLNFEQEIQTFVSRTRNSQMMQQEAVKWLPGGNSREGQHFDPNPIFVDYGEGHYVYDVDGIRYLDFVMNATSLILGHANPSVVSALTKQASKGTSFAGPTESQSRLAKILCERVPSLDSVRFVNSGSEATMHALRAARAFTGKHKIAKMEGGYHGSHEYTSISFRIPGDRFESDAPVTVADYNGQPQSILEDVIVLPVNDIEQCQKILRQHADDLACVIFEPIASVLGYVPCSTEFLNGMRQITDELGILLIYDEVQTLRVAPGGAQQLLGVVPDLTAMGKIVGGGMPAGAFGGRQDIMDLFDPRDGGAVLLHAGTFNSNPMTMVAGEVTLKTLTPNMYERLDKLGDMTRAKLRAVFDELEVPAQITGVASFFGIHFNTEKITDNRVAARDDTELKRALTLGLLNDGIMLGGTVCTLTTESEIDKLVNGVREVMYRVRGYRK